MHGFIRAFSGKNGVKLIHLLKQEFLKLNQMKKPQQNEFLRGRGTWEDDRTVKEQIKDIYSNRKSTSRIGKVF